jgi:MoaA/NifB/PqqE/SkfB family radical SAM enzyme
MEFEKLHVLFQSLADNGFTEIRFTGREPLTNRDLIPLMNYHTGFSYTVLSTLLSPPETMEVMRRATTRKVSLTTVFDGYNMYHRGGNWSVFLKNFYQLNSDVQGDLEIYSTITAELLNNIDYIKSTALFLNSLMYTPRQWSLFPAYDRQGIYVSEAKRASIEELLLQVYQGDLTVSRTAIQKNPEVCHAPAHTIYITNSGNIFPCCMAGGEVGRSTEGHLMLGTLNKDGSLPKYEKQLLVGWIGLCDSCTEKYRKLK